MDTSLALQHGLLYGVIFSVVMTVFVIGSLRLNTEMWLGDYPPDIRAKWGPMSPRAAWLRLWVGVPMLVVVLALIALEIVQLVQRSGGVFSLWGVALSLWVSMMLFNVFDLLVIDWFYMLILKPQFMILPGTEGMKGYTDYAFHFYGFLKGSLGITIASPILAAVAYGVWLLLR
jgi:hypothetical protein